MPRLASYILPPTEETKKEEGNEKSQGATVNNYNTLIKLSNQQLLELLKSYSANQKSIKLVVKDHKIQGIKVGDKFVCKVSNLKESRIDLFASLANTKDPPTKCVGLGRINGRLNPINMRFKSSERLSGVEYLFTKFKAIETLAAQTNENEHSISPSDLSKLLNDGVHPSMIRSIYKDIITKKEGASGLRPECLSQISNTLPTPELDKYLTNLGYRKGNPFRILTTTDKNAIPVFVKDHKPTVKGQRKESVVPKQSIESESAERKKLGQTEKETEKMKIKPIDSKVIRIKRHQKLTKKIELHPIEPYPQLKPISKHKTPKVAPYPMLSPVHKDETSKRDKITTVKRRQASKEPVRLSHIDSPLQSEMDSTGSMTRRKRTRRSLSNDKRSSSSSVSSSSASVRRSNQSSPLTPYTTEGEDEVTKTDPGIVRPKGEIRNEQFGDEQNTIDFVSLPLSKKRRFHSNAEVRQLILKFQDTYRRYYQLYKSLENAAMSTKPLKEVNDKVRTLVSLHNDLRCWKLELERIN